MGIFDFKKSEEVSLSKEDELITVSEACKLLSVSDETLRRWERAGKIKSYRLSASENESALRAIDYRGKRYKLADLQKFVKPNKI